MEPGARTPEELETLFEDAFVTRDAAALQAMFADGGVLLAGSAEREVRGAAAIGRCATALWEHDDTYVAARRRRRLALRHRAPVRARHHGEGGTPMTQQILDAVAVRSDEGDARWWFAALAIIRATGADTGGQMT